MEVEKSYDLPTVCKLETQESWYSSKVQELKN